MYRIPTITLAMIALAACGTPKQAVTLADLTVAQTEVLKRDIEAYASSVNASRVAAAERLSEVQARGAQFERRTEAERSTWQLAGNKKALEMLKALRAADPARATDIYAIAGIQREVERALKEQFGSVSVDTSAYADVITKTKTAVEPDRAAQVSFAVKFVEQLLDGTGLANERVSELLGIANAAAAGAADTLEGEEETN